MSDTDRWLEKAKARALALCSAYRRQLDGLWWLNLMFVVTPAVGTAAAAIVAALPSEPRVFLGYFWMPLASVLAGGSAVLMAVHKSLKCDEYQEECLRISQSYEKPGGSTGVGALRSRGRARGAAGAAHEQTRDSEPEGQGQAAAPASSVGGETLRRDECVPI